MSDSNKRPEAETRRKPEQQTDEKHGSVKRGQLHDQTMPEKDLARGSEPETAGASGRRQ